MQGLPCPAARLKKVTSGRGPGKGSGRGTTYCGPTGMGISPGGGSCWPPRVVCPYRY